MIIGLSKTESKNKIRKSNKALAHDFKGKKHLVFKAEVVQDNVILCVLSFYELQFKYYLIGCITRDIYSQHDFPLNPFI